MELRQNSLSPPEFMFELNREEFNDLRRIFGASRLGITKHTPTAFTEQGVAMFAPLNAKLVLAVLSSKKKAQGLPLQA